MSRIQQVSVSAASSSFLFCPENATPEFVISISTRRNRILMTLWFSRPIVPQYRQAEVCGRRFRGKDDCLVYLPCIVEFTTPSLQLSMNRPVKYEVLCHRNKRFGQLQRTVIPSLALGNYHQNNRSLLHIDGRLKSKRAISSHLITLLPIPSCAKKPSLSITHLYPSISS